MTKMTSAVDPRIKKLKSDLRAAEAAAEELRKGIAKITTERITAGARAERYRKALEQIARMTIYEPAQRMFARKIAQEVLAQPKEPGETRRG